MIQTKIQNTIYSFQELDFIHEGKNAERCAKELDKFDFVHVPEVEWELTSTVMLYSSIPMYYTLNLFIVMCKFFQRVLTAEWIDGYKISDVERIKDDKFNIADIDRKLFKVFSEQIFNTGFVHADPHPGNVFLRKRKDGKPEIVLLDHGLYEVLPSAMRRSLCLFWESIVLKDQSNMNKYANELHVKGQ